MAHLNIREEHLSNAPLKEVVFEVHWDLDVKIDGEKYDKDFDFALGLFHSLIAANGFPFDKKIFPSNSVSAYTTSTQFWAGQNTFPVVQIGPGVVTVNHSGGYRWDNDFKKLISLALKTLVDSYREEPKFIECNLRYINAIDLSPEESSNLHSFLSRNFQTSVNREFPISGDLVSIAFDEIYRLEDSSELRLILNSGVNESIGVPALIWQNMVTKHSRMTLNEINDWADYAHEQTSNLFVTMLNQEFYDSFT